LRYILTVPPGGLKSVEHFKLHPFGNVPILKDEDVIVYESSVIVEYLDAKVTLPRLTPEAAVEAARARTIAAIASEYVQRSLQKLSAAPESSPAELNRALDGLEDAMASEGYACGNAFSIADVYTAPSLWFATAIMGQRNWPDPFASRPKMRAYLAMMQADDVAGEVLTGMERAWRAYASSGEI
jgi:glutathione S-transferase